jgi:hypothetical protein
MKRERRRGIKGGTRIRGQGSRGEGMDRKGNI